MHNVQAYLTFNNGVSLPRIGFGIYQTLSEKSLRWCRKPLEVGYHHIDTDGAYGNEKGVGEALNCSALECSEIFVEIKVLVVDYGHEQTCMS